MFPRARRLMEKEQLRELGQQLADAKQSLIAPNGRALIKAKR